MLIPLNEQYVAVEHIVQIIAHPIARDVCVILSNNQEIRIPVADSESKAGAVARVARYIREKSV